MNKILCFIIALSFVHAVDGQDQSSLIVYKKGACFGYCPIYNVNISPEGILYFEAKRFMDRLGNFERRLSKKEFRKVKRKFRRARMQKIILDEQDRIADAPLTTIVYKEYEIKSKLGTPERLLKAEEYLLSLTPLNASEDFDWRFIPVEENSINVERKGRIENAQNELIVELKGNVDFNKWLETYEALGLSYKKRIVPNRPLYLLRYQAKSTSFKSMLKRLKSDSNVISAEQNMKIQDRRS